MAAKQEKLDISDLLQGKKLPRGRPAKRSLPEETLPEEIPFERVVHWNIYECLGCGRTYECPGSLPSPVMINCEIIHPKRKCKHQTIEVPHNSAEMHGHRIIIRNLDGPYAPADLPMREELHAYTVEKCRYCLSAPNYHPEQLDLFGRKENEAGE